jgi:hypothetical protein
LPNNYLTQKPAVVPHGWCPPHSATVCNANSSNGHSLAESRGLVWLIRRFAIPKRQVGRAWNGDARCAGPIVHGPHQEPRGRPPCSKWNPIPRHGWTAGLPGGSLAFLISSSAPTARFDLLRIECADRPGNAGSACVHEAAERRVQR